VFTIAAPTTAVTINENSLPVGWSLSGATCVNAASATVGSLSGSTYTITGAEVVASVAFTCTFTNGALVSDVVPPAAPTGITVVISGIDTVTISWQAPVDDGGAPIQSYTVTATPVELSGNASTKNSTSCTVTGNPPPTSCQISGLMPGVTYTFNVEASNGTGRRSGTGVRLTIPIHFVRREVIPASDTWALLLVVLGVMAMAWHGFAGRR
jgi:hypothetical protein